MSQERLLPEAAQGEPDQVAPTAAKTRPNQARLYRPVRNQLEWVLRDLDSSLPADHQARAIWALVERLDLSAFYAPIKAVEGGPGHPATDPQVLVALWLYATAQGEGSARALDRLCHEHDGYRWLCGGVPVNYHLLSDFRVAHRLGLDELLSDVLTAMAASGLVSLERVAQDGLRVRASAGASSFRREARLAELQEQAAAQVRHLSGQAQAESEADRAGGPPTAKPVSRREAAARQRAARECQARVEQALAELPAVRAAKKTAEKKEQARVSTTDPDSRVMKMADGGFRPAFNVQLATTTDKQIIVGVSVSNRGSEGDEAPPMLDQVKERSEQEPKDCLVQDYLIDGGQATLGTIDKLSAAGVTVYAPSQAPRGTKRTQAEPRQTDSAAVAAWRARMATDEAKAIYKQRAATAECANARARQHGAYQFGVRGVAKVTCVALWLAITHDLLRWIVLTTGTLPGQPS